MDIELGVDTFGDVTLGAGGKPLTQAQVIRNVVDEAVLAEQAGLDVIGIGEHHRDDFAVSSPEMVLAGIAGRTTRLRLASAVTVLSSDDPVRVYERFSTLDALSSGRAEVIVGRGSFTESFPLFGFDLTDYQELFEEKLAMFVELRNRGRITWQGNLTQSLDDVEVFPRVEHGPLTTWVAVGGSPESVIRAARHGLDLMLAIIGGPVDRFAPFVELYHRALAQLGQPEGRVGFHSFGHVAATDEEAIEQYFGPYVAGMTRVGRDRGWRRPTPDSFRYELEHGSMTVGSPETVARKIVAGVRALGASRFSMKVSTGPMAHELISSSIELYGTKVAPLVRDMLS
ncbi:MAG TPA: LLM class flavin-dependent oxidoreductase [Propionibacteriaceae bacterium]|nr:LLM class flavin-dependent oxidoreductase [Propionibacteriaceae bacterium]